MLRSTFSRIGLVTKCPLIRLSLISNANGSRTLAIRAQPRTFTTTVYRRRTANMNKQNPPQVKRSGAFDKRWDNSANGKVAGRLNERGKPELESFLPQIHNAADSLDPLLYLILIAYLYREFTKKTKRTIRESIAQASSTNKFSSFHDNGIIGGPGSGKGTQCRNISKEFGFTHLSAGDLLRAEKKRPGSKYGELINTRMKEGKIVPMEITNALLEQAMLDDGGKRFLIDGFPVQMGQAVKFEKEVAPAQLVLYLECPENVMLKRLLKRGETSGRVDDNAETIRRRFKTFVENSYPIVDYYKEQGKIRSISCVNPPDVVYQEVKEIMNKEFGKNKNVI
ncbi:5657_t:CDS:2 [Acaulospora morrowiae]|uniref:Uridylate kinase n=1 Tax=Acaulospora morrowiae TaxID=94023 RepID=A0A9N8ZT39_9GLOM|nr:5657_t:CDS:2 [Acaulospora morrowiae]